MVLIVDAVGLDLHYGSRLWAMNNFIEIELIYGIEVVLLKKYFSSLILTSKYFLNICLE